MTTVFTRLRSWPYPPPEKGMHWMSCSWTLEPRGPGQVCLRVPDGVTTAPRVLTMSPRLMVFTPGLTELTVLQPPPLLRLMKRSGSSSILESDSITGVSKPRPQMSFSGGKIVVPRLQ